MFQISYLTNSFYTNFNTNLILYILILPNLAFSLFLAVPNIGQTWSIGVEEQFYIFWPWLISKSKNVFKTLVILIIILVILKILVLLLGKFYTHTVWYKPLKLFVAMSKFECMAIGGIGAYLLFSNNKFLKLIYNKYILLISVILIPLLIYITPDKLQDGIHIIYSFLFLIIVINISNKNNKINFENRVFNYLGKISYGIYMYHFMIIPAVLFIFKNYMNIDAELFTNIGIYTLTISITIMVAGFSYYLFERPFINFKSRFSLIKTEKNSKFN